MNPEQILFYSNHCDYSKKIYNFLKDKSTILTICVDDDSLNIPPFITAVPSIVIPKENNRLIMDEGVEMWCRTTFGDAQQSQGNAQQSQGNAQQSPTQSNTTPGEDNFTGGFSFSPQFAPLGSDEDNSNNLDNDFDGGCGFDNFNNPTHIITPDQNDKPSDTNSMFEQFQQSRNRDNEKMKNNSQMASWR
jgi:hypothetical protein